MKKVSLHVGLNYPGTSAELYGCVNDANDWAFMLGRLDYETKTLIEPTGDMILAGIRNAVASLRWGDRFVFTFSGHGSYIPDRNGDEVDGLDEVICPADFRRRVVTDDELAMAFDQARFGVRRTFLSDSCHSGSVSRAMRQVFAGGSLARTRFMHPSLILDADQAEAAVAAVGRGVTPRASKVPAVLISGCADNEYSYDASFGNRANGAFTRVAIDAHAPGQTMAAWFRTIRSGLPNGSFPQTPQLTARLHQRYWKL